jgi:hypothetical protein
MTCQQKYEQMEHKNGILMVSFTEGMTSLLWYGVNYFLRMFQHIQQLWNGILMVVCIGTMIGPLEYQMMGHKNGI